MAINVRRKPSSFEEYWLMSKAWEKRGMGLAAGRALANAGILTIGDLQTAQDLELASIPPDRPEEYRHAVKATSSLLRRLDGAAWQDSRR